jgi:hypothetical protein
MRRAVIAVPLALALATGAVGTLSGCGMQKTIDHVTHGNVDLGGKSIPPDFPKAVPLVHGEVLYGASVGSTGRKVWNVTVKVHDADTINDISAQLERAGFTRSFGTGSATGATARFVRSPYAVLVVMTQDAKNGWVANYTVTRSA